MAETIGSFATLISGNSDFSTSKDETALIDEQERYSHKYYILNGDFRGAYLELIENGFEACLEYFNSQKEKAESVWSDTKETK